MITTFTLPANELSADILEAIKTAFKNKKVKLTVSEEKMDETEYLLSSEANRKHLEKSIRQVKEGKVVTFEIDDFLKIYREKVKNAQG